MPQGIGSDFAWKEFEPMSQHILIVDDEPQIRDLLSVYFLKQGYRVSTAANSAETERTLQQSDVDLVVLDIGLGEEDGLKLLAKLKATFPGILVIGREQAW